jgi:hypothetical protein
VNAYVRMGGQVERNQKRGGSILRLTIAFSGMQGQVIRKAEQVSLLTERI